MGGTTKCLEEELMQLTLQIRDKKNQDAKYASFRGDKLLGVSTVCFSSQAVFADAFQDGTTPKVGSWSDLEAIIAYKNWPALRKLIDGALLRKGLDVCSATHMMSARG